MNRIAHLLSPDAPPGITLLPCPFCGAPAKVYRIQNDGWMVSCADDDPDSGCEILCTAGPYATAEEAGRAWNRRGGNL